MRRWMLSIVAAVALIPMSGATARSHNDLVQGDCGLTQAEYNAIVEDLQDSETQAEVFAKLENMPADLAECVEEMLELEREIENAQTADDIRRERSYWPAAEAVIADYGIRRSDIAQVAWIQPIDSDGTSLEEIEIVTMDNGQTYYYFPGDESTTDEVPPSLLWTNERRERGTGMTRYQGSCTSSEWAVRFPTLPTCFKEIAPGRFDGIDDAWAGPPNCSWYCHPSCAYGACGPAWEATDANPEGDHGYMGWRGFAGCSGRDATWTTDAGKMVQKRWYYSWNGCLANKTDSQIANMVERLIHW